MMSQQSLATLCLETSSKRYTLESAISLMQRSDANLQSKERIAGHKPCKRGLIERQRAGKPLTYSQAVVHDGCCGCAVNSAISTESIYHLQMTYMSSSFLANYGNIHQSALRRAKPFLFIDLLPVRYLLSKWRLGPIDHTGST